MKRVLVTGSRDWSDQGALALELGQALGELVRDGAQSSQVTLVSGACPTGADAIAEALWSGYGLPVERHPADWKQYGKRAGFVRNAEMIELGADLCLAFLGNCTKREHADRAPHPSHGTAMCADLAEEAGIETRRFTA